MKQTIQKQVLIILFVIAHTHCFSQQQNLAIGDAVPDVLMKHIVNYKTTEAKISDFKGRLLILDFWATWCAPCISMLGVCDTLQQQFKDSIQILPITDQYENVVTGFLNNMKRAKNITTLSVTGDTILNRMFVHSQIPHYVWIDANSKVIAITGVEALNAKTIEQYLNTKKIETPVKQDVLKHINEKQTMFIEANALIQGNETHVEAIDNSALLYHSVLTRYINGFGCETGADSTKITCKNNCIGGLYRIASGQYQLSRLLLNSTIWKVTNPAVAPYSDSALLSVTKSADVDRWNKTYDFCYELKYPTTLYNKRFDIMLQDLNNYFGSLYNIEGGLEKTTVKVLALIRTNQETSFATKGINNKTVYNQFYLKISDQPMYALINFLSFEMDLLPQLVDETGYKGNIDIELNCDQTDLKAVNNKLADYGLQLVEKEEVRDMIVIKDKPKANN